MELKKINMNFYSNLLEKIDNHAKRNGLNRTQFVTFVLINYFTQLENNGKENK